MAGGDDVHSLRAAVVDLHRRTTPFPGEVFMRLAVDALDLAGVARVEPLPHEGPRERFLPEYRFRGRESRKIQYAILATGSLRGGIEPDLLDEVIWWQTDDFWAYALLAAVAIIRSCCDRLGKPAASCATRLADARGVALW